MSYEVKIDKERLIQLKKRIDDYEKAIIALRNMRPTLNVQWTLMEFRNKIRKMIDEYELLKVKC